MKNICRSLAVLQVLFVLLPIVHAKTHRDNYSVSCDVLWRGVNDILRNSGKYQIAAMNDTAMTASFKIGTFLSKRTNSVVLNRTNENSCEMQIQSVFSGLVNNDYADFKKRVDESVSKLPKGPDPHIKADGFSEKTPDILLGETPTKSQFPPGIMAGQTPKEVELVLGKPKDSVEVNESLVYIFPGYKLIFEKGLLTEVQYTE
jgi:hypothetical protein